MSETFSISEPNSNRAPDFDALAKKQQAILNGEIPISDVSEQELRDIDAMNYPDREEDVDKAHAIALAINPQESGMAHSRQRLQVAGEAVAQLEEAGGSKRLIREIESDVSDISPDAKGNHYWDDIMEQRDKKAAEAAAAYETTKEAAVSDARADVEKVFKQ